jgi:tetratricopeptide (TPR) repeat protein
VILGVVLIAACAPVPGAKVSESPGGDLVVEVREAQSFNALSVYLYGDAQYGPTIARAANLPYDLGVPAGAMLTLPPKIEIKRLADQDRKVDSLVRSGNKAMRAGKFDEAAGKFREALQVRPDRTDVKVLLGEAYLRAGNESEAGPLLEEAARLQPGNPEARYQCGVWLRKAGKLERALAEFEGTLDATARQEGGQRGHARAQFDFARTLHDLGRYSEAARAYRTFLYEYPGDAWTEDAQRALEEVEELLQE